MQLDLTQDLYQNDHMLFFSFFYNDDLNRILRKRMWKQWEGWERYIDEEWKHICYIYIGDDIYEYETEDKKVTEDFAKFNPVIYEWLSKRINDDICLTIKIYPDLELAMYAVGVWKIDIDEDSDNRVYREADYEQVTKWLEKRGKEGKK